MRIPICALAGLFLASCGGGGGGSSSSITTSSPPPPAPTLSSQSFSTINTEGVASVDSSGHIAVTTQPQFVGGGTVTVNQDGSFVLNVDGEAPVPITNLKFFPTATLGTFESGSGNAQAVAGASLFPADGLSVSDYGVWTQANAPNTLVFGALAGGQATPVENLPKTGSAVYNGHTVGVLILNGVPNGLAGSATVTADFGNSAVSTNFSNFQASAGDGSVTPLSGSFGSVKPGTLSSGAYQTSLTGTLGATAVSGTSNGQFFGSQAEETAGVWGLQGTGLSATGAFGARR